MCIYCKYFPDELQQIEELQTNLIETMEKKLKLPQAYGFQLKKADWITNEKDWYILPTQPQQ